MKQRVMRYAIAEKILNEWQIIARFELMVDRDAFLEGLQKGSADVGSAAEYKPVHFKKKS